MTKLLSARVAAILLVLSIAPLAQAQGEAEEIRAAPAGSAETSPAEVSEEQSPRARGLKAVVRGLYLESQVGGGYMVLDAKVEDDAYNPGIDGKEQLGAGASIQVAVGYDITDMVAVQLLGGAVHVSGGRSDKVRDLGVVFGGLGLRLALDIGSRTDWVICAGPVYTNADNAVEKPQAGIGGLATTGIEYYVHVRHFSVGLDLSVFLPTFDANKTRLFVSVAPMVKYTF